MTRHPPMQPGWIDRPHERMNLGRFGLESGEAIESMELSYVVHGDLSDRSRPVVLGLCAIGSTHHRLDFLIGAGRAFDPARCTVIVIDALGNGLSASPSNSMEQPGRRFPRFTIRDLVRSQHALLERLGVGSLACVAGASMGGMQALQWGVLYRSAMRSIVAMTPMAATEPWAAAINHVGRRCLEHAEPDWSAWVATMQVLAMRTPARFARDVEAHGGNVTAWLAARTEWWLAQGADPLDWIYQSWAYDAHDVGTTPGFGGDTHAALRSICARTLICAPPLDLYNPVDAAERAARDIPDCTYLHVDSDSGHLMATDADPAAAARLNDEIARFVGI
jgi:homoserine O-acetyltransferase